MVPTAGVVLAAGLGTRMKSSQAKVLHQVCGRPMLLYVIDALRGAGAERIVVVVGYQSEKVKQVLGNSLEYAFQERQLGTGHALMQVEPLLSDHPGTVVVVNGDAPLLRSETLVDMIRYHQERRLAATVLTALVPDATGYGRVIRDKDGNVTHIAEHKDASPEERQVTFATPWVSTIACSWRKLQRLYAGVC
jgi:bifunctional UDP-N-acetylglucosamine pyrophosphorylase/glucosamine-1-phosphate N-acetyltransferase